MTNTTAVWTREPISEGRKNFIRTLLAERQITAEQRDKLFAEAQGMTNSGGIEWIAILKAAPKKGGQADAPRSDVTADLGVYSMGGDIFAVRQFKAEGKVIRYARRGEFTTVDHKVVPATHPDAHRVDWIKAPGMQYKLATGGTKLTVAEIEALSIQFDQCFICGRRLDVLASKERGIGPVCLAKIGY